MTIRVKSAPPENKAQAPKETVTVFLCDKSEGWFRLHELEIDKAILEAHAKSISVTEPDVFPSFLDQLEMKVRKNYDL